MGQKFGDKDQLIQLFSAVSSNSVQPMNSMEVAAVKNAFDVSNILTARSAGVNPYYGKYCFSTMNRWLRFDPANRKGIVIKACTGIKKPNGTFKVFNVDTHIDLTDQITTPGADYFLFLNNDETITATTDKSTGTGVYFGRFHTLCVDAGTMTMISPASPSSGISVGDKFLVKPYNQETDPDFYSFYNRTVSAVSAGTPYDVITTDHPLSGYLAGDILPESIMCLSFRAKSLFEDAMVYDVVNDIFVDVYLQSGTGLNTRSAYNQTHTVSRHGPNHNRDMMQVGKRLLSDAEFYSCAIGSNEATNITGSSDKTTVGGHVDSASRRMISAIGCEECCGYLWQWLSDIGPVGGSDWQSFDGRASFGQLYGSVYGLVSGGCWYTGGNAGSCARTSSYSLSSTDTNTGARGCTSVDHSDFDFMFGLPMGNGRVTMDYSLDEQVVGTWIDGKPLYQKSLTGLNGPAATSAWYTIASLPTDCKIVLYDFYMTLIAQGWTVALNSCYTASTSNVMIVSIKSDCEVQVYALNNAYIGNKITVYGTVWYTKSTD